MPICILGFYNLITETVRLNNFSRKMEETDVFMSFFFFFFVSELVSCDAFGTRYRCCDALCGAAASFPLCVSHGGGRSSVSPCLRL